MVEPRESCEDVKRDARGRRTAREPRPESVAIPLKPQLLNTADLLALEADLAEEVAEPRAGSSLMLRLAHPRRRLERNRLQLRIGFQRALKRLGASRLPRIERLADSRIGIRDKVAKCVRVVAAKCLLAAFVRKLHKVRKRQHRVPCRTRHRAHGEVLVADRLRPLACKKVVELEQLRLVAARVELHRLTDEYAPCKNGKHAFLAVGELLALRLGYISQVATAVGNRKMELKCLRLMRSQRESLALW